ncbi:MAG: NAD(P)-dependent oxidoreductase [Bacteroidota bacterium]
MKIGFIGLGIMGSRMAGKLLEGGYDISVWNRTKSKADPLIAKGAKWAESATELSLKTNVIFTMLSTPEAVREIATGEHGFLPSFGEGNLWADSSTVNPSFSREMACLAKELGVRFVDAPVAGSLKPAAEGKLLFLCGGDKDDIAYIKPLLELMGRDYIHAGDTGMGASLKMLINMLMGQAVAAFSEAVNLGTALGFDENELLDILLGLPVVADIVSLKKENFINKNFDPEFPLKWMQKDLHLASVSAWEKDISMPTANAAKELFALAKQKGLGESDFSAVYDFIQNKKL